MVYKEIKVADEDFPYAITENLGYHVFHHGQKGITVSQLLTKQEPKAVRRGFPTDNEDAQKTHYYGGFRNAIWFVNGN